MGPGARVLLSPLWCCFTAQSLCLRPSYSPEHPGVPKPQLTLAASLKHPEFSFSLRRIQLPAHSALCSWTLSCQSEFSQPLSSGERMSGWKRCRVLSVICKWPLAALSGCLLEWIVVISCCPQNPELCGSLLLMSAPAIPLLLSQLPRVLGNLHMPLDDEDEHPPGAGFSPQQMLPPVSGPMLGPIGHTLCSFS